jgi:rod shape-determining protein MreC
MNKNFLSLIFLGAILFAALSFNKQVQSSLIELLNELKITYFSIKETLYANVEQHFNQAQTIAKLNKELKDYPKTKLLLQQYTTQLQELYTIANSPLSNNPQVALVRTIAYQKLGNKNRLWIEIPNYDPAKIYGLTYKGFVAGIVIPSDGKALALLNNDIKSTYAVFVGKEQAPGIAHGNNGVNIVVNFIPSWFEIKVGDEVSTSGLDKLFFKGLPVGKVIKVTATQGYKSAVVQPYYQDNDPNYFYLIRSVK